MVNTIKNIILICAMSAVAIMCVGLFLYDLMPSGITVSNANKYQTASSTTEVLSDAKEAQSLSVDQSFGKNSSSSQPVKTNIVLKEYEVTKTDLAISKQSGSYVSGRADPFAELANTATGNAVGNSTGNPSTNTTVTNTTTTPGDGTFYNSTRVK